MSPNCGVRDKTLTDVEPRIAINALNTPGDANSVYRISQPGSYYLTGPVQGQNGQHGLWIMTGGVTIDLNGFELVGGAGSLTGIRVAAPGLSNITIFNGTVRSWGGSGVDMMFFEPVGVQLRDVKAAGNAFAGIRVFSGQIDSCTATANGREGIITGAAVVTNCHASYNEFSGIELGTGSSAVGCISTNNRTTGIYATGTGVVVADSTASNNTYSGIIVGWGGVVRNCTSSSNGGIGIQAGARALISGCAATSNGTIGISAAVDNHILNNSSHNNGQTGSGAGISVAQGGNRIEGNTCNGNRVGFLVGFSGNLIVRNSGRNNGVDWEIAANNAHGPIIDRRAPASPAVNGFAAPSSLATFDPNANFSY